VDKRDRVEVGRRIAEARRESGMTQAELAAALQVTVRSIQNYESGVSVPYRHLRTIESLTHKRPGWTLDGDGDGALDAKIAALQRTIETHQAAMELHLRLMREHTERLREQRRASESRRSGGPRR
jgi:transcriptional regulator with XRE-family HTH domain